MSGKAGSIGGIVLGAVLVIAGAYTLNPQLALTGVVLVGGGVAGLTLNQQPKAQNAEAAKAQDMQFANSSEGYPVPVVIGRQKITPNFMNWEASTFRAVEGTIPAGGKGGGQKSTASGVIDYYLTFELALCMGPIDEIGQIISVPGDVFTRGREYTAGNGAEATQSGVTVTASLSVFNSQQVGGDFIWADGEVNKITGYVSGTQIRLDASATKTSQRFQVYKAPEQVVFDSEEYAEMTLSGINEGGLIRVYKGSETQTRINANDPYYDTGMNYRGMAWALFMDFWIARGSPTPKTYQFIVTRLPKCIRDNATTVTAIVTRGSINPLDPSYNEANPAAAIYEILTNKLWGRGLSSDLIDEDSFATCSEFFRDKNIGISLTLDTAEKLTTVLDTIRTQLGVILSWNGGVWKMRCLMDTAQTHANILTLTTNEVFDLRATRPMWAGVVNDLRAEFNSANKFYKAEPVHVQNLANIEQSGAVKSASVSLRAFTDWNLATRMATRMLMQISYPASSITFKMNRFKSHLEIGDSFRLVWNEWGDATVTGYFSVLKIEPLGKSDDAIAVTAIEDSFLTAIAGEESSVTVPTVAAWEKIVTYDYDDLSLRSAPDSQNGSIYPIIAIEIATNYSTRINFFGQKPSAGTVSSEVYWSSTVVNDYKLMPAASVEFVVMALSATAVNHARAFDRSASFVEFVIANAADADTILAFNRTNDDEDHLEVLERETGSWLIIGEEICKVGYIEQISSTQFRARNVLRGQLGSEIVPHPTSSTVILTDTIGFGTDVYGQGTNGLPVTSPPSPTKFRAYPVTSNGVNQVGDDFFIFHEGSENNQLLLGIGATARTPEVLSVERTTGVVSGFPTEFLTVTIRQRRRFDWAGITPLLGEYNAATDLMTGLVAKEDAFYESFYSSLPAFALTYANSEISDFPITSGYVVSVTNIGSGKFEIELAVAVGGTMIGTQLRGYIGNYALGIKYAPDPFYAAFGNT